MTDTIILADDLFKPDYGDPPTLTHEGIELKPTRLLWTMDGFALDMWFPVGTPFPQKLDGWRQQFALQGWYLWGRYRYTANEKGEKGVWVFCSKDDSDQKKLDMWNKKVQS